eukprot:195121-Pleurochrysis_carterae.AAC.1
MRNCSCTQHSLPSCRILCSTYTYPGPLLVERPAHIPLFENRVLADVRDGLGALRVHHGQLGATHLELGGVLPLGSQDILVRFLDVAQDGRVCAEGRDEEGEGPTMHVEMFLLVVRRRA